MFVKERFVLDPAIIDKLYSMTPKFGYNGFGELVYYRTYSRKICATCRTTDIRYDGVEESCANCGIDFPIGQETWNDTVRRVTEGTFSIRKDWYVKNRIGWDESFWQHYAMSFAISMFNLNWLPPGRGLWAQGTPFVYNRGSMALQNCGNKHLTDNLGFDIEWFADALMCGVGVGFLPIRNNQFKVYNPTSNYEYVIPDSREGWAYSLKILINSYIKKGLNKIRFIYDKIRGPGQPIRGFGGISSGPEPLRLLHDQVRQFFDMYQTHSWYDSVLLKADIANCVGCCIVSGNVRRSAELLAGEMDDVINLKNYEMYPYRESHAWMANNSVLMKSDSDFERLGEIAQRVVVNAEPGIINLRNLPFGRIGKPMNGLKNDSATNFNPCQPYSAKILTPDGIRDFGTLVVGDKIWSQVGWTTVTKFWSTGNNPVQLYKTTAGTFKGTAKHRLVYENLKIEAELASGVDILRGPYIEGVVSDPQAIVDGLVVGDGSMNHKHVCLVIGEDYNDYMRSEIKEYIGTETSCRAYYEIATTIGSLPVTYLRSVPKDYFYGNRNKICNFLRGIYSANGGMVGVSVGLTASSLEIIEQVSMMLSSIGIKSSYSTNKPTTLAPRQSYKLRICEDAWKFAKIIGFLQPYKNQALQIVLNRESPYVCKKFKDTFDIIEVTDLGVEETFDVTVDNIFHTYWTGGLNVSNCGEIPLNDGEMCTLSETFPTMCDSTDSWMKAIEYATLYAATVTLLPTHSAFTNAIMLKNRRVGVGITDIVGWQNQIGTTSLIKNLRNGYDKVVNTAAWTNDEAGIPRPIRHTTVKPSGTISKLAGVRSGCHAPTFAHTLRRIRIAQNSSMFSILHNANIPHEPDVFSANTEVFEYPIDQCDNGRIKPATEISLWQQAMLLILLQREWADNSVSNTLYFRPKWPMISDYNLGNSFYEPDQAVLAKLEAILPMSWEDFLQVQEWEGTDYRVILALSKWANEYHLQIFKFDPRHEEDSVESVLAAIAPLTKSISMLPHTANGVYLQTPEEGITQAEYDARLAAIRPIDWSKLVGSDGQDEKYCSGPSCEVIVK